MPATAAPERIDLAALIDAAPLSARQHATFVLCGLVAMMDGFDLQIVGSLAPTLADILGVPVNSFGTVFGAGFLGILVGSMAMGAWADRAGRKAMILLALGIAGVMTLMVPALALAGWLDLRGLVVCRFLAGIGVGGAMPNVLALTAEYAPRRSRALIVNTMYCGVPLGSVSVGLATALLASAFGWQLVFVMGGVGPLLLLVCCAVFLPESARSLIARGAEPARVRALSARLLPGARLAADAVLFLREPADARPTLRSLLSEGRSTPTILLWITMFLNLLVIVFVLSWLPAVMRGAGLPMQVGILLAALFSLGGIAGSVLVGRLIDRFGATPVLLASYLSAAVAVCGYGWAVSSVGVLYAVTMAAGATVIGAQSGVTAFAAGFYPTAMRSTGLGWALGVGRLGSIVGPALGAVMLANRWSVTEIFSAAALPALAAAGLIALIARLSPALAKTSA